MDAYYLIRGLKTLSVRFDRQTQNTHKIIKFLEDNDAVSVVHFPGSYSEQEAKMQAAQASDIGALISFELDEKYDVNKFVKALELLRLAIGIENVDDLIADLDQAFKKAKK